MSITPEICCAARICCDNDSRVQANTIYVIHHVLGFSIRTAEEVAQRLMDKGLVLAPQEIMDQLRPIVQTMKTVSVDSESV